MLARMETVRARAVLARTPALSCADLTTLLAAAGGEPQRALEGRVVRAAQLPPAARDFMSAPAESAIADDLSLAWAQRRANPAVHRPGVPAAAAADRRAARRALRAGLRRRAELAAARHGRLAQSDARRARHRARVRCLVCARRPHRDQRARAGDRRREPRRGARRRRADGRGVRHRARPGLPAGAPGARAAHRGARRAGVGIPAGHAAGAREFPAAQPHHQRAVASARWWWRRHATAAR